MSTRDAGSIADAPGHEDYTPEQLAAMSPAELDALGAGYDGVRVLHVDPPPAPGSSLERRATRQVGLLFGLAGLLAFAFVVIYVGSGWFLPDWHFEIGSGFWDALFTPLLGVMMGLSLFFVGAGLVVFTKKLLPHETAVQEKHDSSHLERVTTGATMMSIGRRRDQRVPPRDGCNACRNGPAGTYSVLSA